VRFLFVLALILAALWILSAVLPRTFSSEALNYFDEKFLIESQRRAKLSYIAFGLESALSFSVLYLFVTKNLFMGVLGRKTSEEHLTLGQAVCLGGVLAVMAGGWLYAVSLPFDIYRNFCLEKAFGLSRMTLGAWFLDYLKGTALGLAVYFFAGTVVALLVVKIPHRWPYFLTVVFFCTSIFFAFIYPSIIAPIFNKFKPLEDPIMLNEVQKLSSKAGLKVNQVLVMEASSKTARINAYFAGLGKTKQVVLYDTLINGRSLEEIRLVLAHEIGHWKFGHILKQIGVSTIGTFLMLTVFKQVFSRKSYRFSAKDLVHYLSYLFLFVVLTSFILNPASSFISRQFETQADEYSLWLTDDPQSFISTQINLAKANLGDVEPPVFIRWFAFSHPTTLERITMARGR